MDNIINNRRIEADIKERDRKRVPGMNKESLNCDGNNYFES